MIHSVVAVHEGQPLCGFQKYIKNLVKQIVPVYAPVRIALPSVVDELPKRFSLLCVNYNVSVSVFRDERTAYPEYVRTVLRRLSAI